MCGIVGCQLQKPLRPDDLRLMRALQDGISHRGPDGEGEFIDEDSGFYLGHKRLSIIDIDPRSNQPMHSENSVLSYNGEIYNYKEIKKQLESEFTFKTESDTEVLLCAWQKWGAKCLDYLDGMFAFALKDDDGLHLVTDPFGEKPLYLYHDEQNYIFASEAPPLIKELDIQPDFSDSTRAEFLHLGFLQAPKTAYKNLLYLPPASHYTIKPGGILEQRTYWHAPVPHIGKGKIHPLDNSEIDQIKDILCTSLKRRLRSDVSIGLFLSSGIDSTLIAALAKKELNSNLETFTVAFEGIQDESAKAADIAQYLDLHHTVINSTEDKLSKNVSENMIEFYGIPIDNPTVFPVYQMCKLAREHLTVAISGLGGDEIFYGYNKYQMFYHNRFLYEHANIANYALNILKHLPFNKIKTARSVLKISKQEQFLRIKNGESAKENNFQVEISDDISLAHAARLFDIKQTMPSNLIPAMDRGSMRASVEVRTPYLNKELFTYCASLDQRRLIHFGKKNALETLLARYIDIELLNRKKQGFVLPKQQYAPGQDSCLSFRTALWDNFRKAGHA